MVQDFKMSHNPNSVKGSYMREIIQGAILELIKEDTRSLDYSSDRAGTPQPSSAKALGSPTRHPQQV